MLVAARHGLGHVAEPRADEPLIDTGGGTIARETVPQNMPAAKHRPLTAGQGAVKVVVGLVPRQRRDHQPFLPAANDLERVAEQALAAGMLLKPVAEDLEEERGQRHAAVRPLAA